MITSATYLIYLMISIGITVSVGHALRKNGLVFMHNHLLGNASLALAINNLLLIGFYLINIGYILLVLNIFSGELESMYSVIHFLSMNLGLVTLMLGAMHLIILYVLANWRPKSVAYVEEAE